VIDKGRGFDCKQRRTENMEVIRSLMELTTTSGRNTMRSMLGEMQGTEERLGSDVHSIFE
jgi:hypothetical protein